LVCLIYKNKNGHHLQWPFINYFLQN
jgi:hypothetical protein